jgi:hypothetical protein
MHAGTTPPAYKGTIADIFPSDTLRRMFEIPEKSVTVTDKTCVDCGGEVTVFAVADKVWDGLGLRLEDWICLGCFARRLNPENPPSNIVDLREEIVRQRRRFKLETFNLYSGEILPRNTPFVHLTVADELVEEAKTAQFWKHCRRPTPYGIMVGLDGIERACPQNAQFVLNPHVVPST